MYYMHSNVKELRSLSKKMLFASKLYKKIPLRHNCIAQYFLFHLYDSALATIIIKAT